MKKLIVSTLIFLFPLFFLPLTQEFFISNKFYLLLLMGLILLLNTIIELIIKKKIVWQKKSFDTLVILLLLTTAISTIITSTNKIQALLCPNFGLAMLVGLTIFYFYFSRQKTTRALRFTFYLSSLILSLITIVFFFSPFKSVNLPIGLQFLKNPVFSTMGGLLDLAIFLGFLVVFIASDLFSSKKKTVFDFIVLGFSLTSLILTMINLFKPTNQLLLPPYRLSWFANVEILKNPLTAFFGIGVDNFSIIFSQVKDVAYNTSNLWQINSFTVSRSTLLHVFTETGVFGLIAILLLSINLFREALKKPKQILPIVIYLLLIILFFPPSLPVFFLLFFVIALIAQLNDEPTQTIDLSKLLPVYISFVVIMLLIVGFLSYFLGRTYLSEIYFKKSIDGYTKNSAREVYENQRQAIILNPHIERFRISFSQTNLLLASNLAAKGEKLTDQDRSNIAQAIQAAISEAKNAVNLNPLKNNNWENLAIIYRNIVNVAQEADVWTISSYLRAIQTDPQNPTYRLNLGGVYYAQNNFDEAIRMFEQAASLKPNWANAYYNLAWSSFKKEDYQRAVNAMENAISLIDQKTSKSDYDKAVKDLAEFKAKIPTTTEETTNSKKTEEQLVLPTPATSLEPKIKLPQEASPEAK